jgi:hypothetical protein
MGNILVKELVCLSMQQQEKIREGLQNQIVAQAILVRDDQPDKYLSYLDSEIEKASNSMLEMVKASGQNGALLDNISEVYIWNKERKRVLMELKSEFMTQQHQSLSPEPQQISKELATPEAQRYFKKAIDLGLMDSNYHWLKGLQMLACFAAKMSDVLDMGKGQLADGRKRISWKPFEALFCLPVGKLRGNFSDIQKTGAYPSEYWLIEKVFE